MEENYYYSTSKKAVIVKDISYLLMFLAIVTGFLVGLGTTNTILAFISALVEIVFSLFLWGIGEVISLLADIRENTEHLRDNIERK